MEQFLLFLPALACPVGMGLMMWFMMRGRGSNEKAATPDQEQELATLKAQIEALRGTPEGPEDRHHTPHAGGSPA